MHTDLVEQQKQHKLDVSSEVAATGGAPTSPQLIFDMYKYLGYHSVMVIIIAKLISFYQLLLWLLTEYLWFDGNYRSLLSIIFTFRR